MSIVIKTGVKKVDTEDPNGILLQHPVVIQQFDVDDDVVVATVWFELETDAHPAMAFIGFVEVQDKRGTVKV